MDVPTPRDDSGQQDVGSVALVDLDTRELELDLDPSLGRNEPLCVVHDEVETLPCSFAIQQFITQRLTWW